MLLAATNLTRSVTRSAQMRGAVACSPVKLLQFRDAAQANQGRASGRRRRPQPAVDRHSGRRPGQAHAVGSAQGAAAAGRHAAARACAGAGGRADAGLDPRGLWPRRRAGARTASTTARLHWALQAEQLGTGHALQQAMPDIPDAHQVLVLYGDVPLLRAETLRGLIDACGARRHGAADRAACRPERLRPHRARRTRRSCGASSRNADASAQRAAIREVNTGVLVAQRAAAQALAGAPQAAQCAGRVLPDRYRRHGGASRSCAIATVEAADAAEVQGVNDRLQLARPRPSIAAAARAS